MNSLNDVWNEVVKALSKDMTPTAIATWFSECEPIDIDGSCLMISIPSDFKRNIIYSRFGGTIREVLSDLFSADFDFQLLTPEEADSYVEQRPEKDPLPEMAGYTFDRFIVGSSNKFAHAAALAVAEKPDQAYNPLFIYGNSGLGKTHLLLAIGQYFREHHPEKKIEYIKGDDFTNQMVKSLKEGKAEEFRTRYRNVDLLLVDDIQFIAGKTATQNEFFHTFNNNYEAGHQIVITSDRPPMEMALLDDRLRTRFEGGLMADIQPPDLETRMAITRNKAAQLGLMLSDEAVAYIGENITANIRQIEGVIKKLTAYKEILNKVIDIEDVKRAIADVTLSGDEIPSPDKIIKETARYYGITPEVVRGQDRSRIPTLARQIAMYLIRTLTNYSLNEIGSEFEGRNHATVLSSIRKIEDLIKSDSRMASTIRSISSNINSN
ncbi:MAG: chromosomal replication initiator protein DnaA [Oscillospiraceae bacterium]|nr:chromosomal replication initiator protein DnaA [Oscillospiraceae bacterium]